LGHTRLHLAEIHAVNFKEHLEATWESTLEFIVPLIIITLVMFGVWFVSFGILTPVTLAGYTQSLLRMLREGRDPQVKDLFAEMNLFLPLLGFTIIAVVAVISGFIFLVLPGIIITFFISFACLFMIPLMTDKKLGLFAAIKESYAMAMRGSPADHLVVVIIYLGIMAIGSAVFIGALFTQPLATVFILSVYDEKMQ
jgi:uncharacterized membrane protein